MIGPLNAEYRTTKYVTTSGSNSAVPIDIRFSGSVDTIASSTVSPAAGSIRGYISTATSATNPYVSPAAEAETDADAGDDDLLVDDVFAQDYPMRK